MEDVDYKFHAQNLLNNPAYQRIWADMRRQLDAERDRCDMDDKRRLEISIAQTLLTRLERRARALANDTRAEVMEVRKA